MIFYILDVFAEEKYAGNQLAVFRGAGDLGTEQMQKLALEMNYSETTFIINETPRDGGYDVRIFTPQTELPFAGHPTLGTAFLIQQEIIGQDVPEVKLNLKVGQIPVTFNYTNGQPDILWMRQIEPTFNDVYPPDQMAQVLGLNVDDFDTRFDIQEVSTGIPFTIVPLKNLDAVKRARVKEELFPNIKKAFLIFSPETYYEQIDLNARVFAVGYGVTEDPATGSANGCLAGWLVRQRYFDSNQIDVQVEQGYEMGRPSQLYLRSSEQNGKFEINVGGKVIPVAKGELTT
ncbi:MAG: PhzF family phenazine biosynthesis protein [Planctomycetes bacterium]|nr:PhzF family phenazine biosynthesis protein [Planctomycetota bacterium]